MFLLSLGQVAGLEFLDDGVVDAVGVVGFLLAGEIEVAVAGDLVVVVPLDAPALGEGVVLEVDAGQGHHAVHGEMVLAVEGDTAVEGIEPVAAEAHRTLMLAGVELAQVDGIDDCAVIAMGHQIDLEETAFIISGHLIGCE